MKEKKLTDEEVIEALECCAVEPCEDCGNCPRFTKEKLCHKANAKQSLDFIHRLQAEIEQLKDEKEEIMLFNLSMQNGEVDMRIESEIAKSFYNSIIQIFEQNGAKNFFTITVDIEGKKGRYAFTIEKVGGQTVAEKLVEQKAEIERLTEENAILKENPPILAGRSLGKTIRAKLLAFDKMKEQNDELQKQVYELKLELQGQFDKGVKAGCLMSKVKEQQAVKETAKDLLIEFNEWINGQYDAKLDTYSVHIPVHEVNDFLTDKAKEYGVEAK